MEKPPPTGRRVIPLRMADEREEISRRTFVRLVSATMLAAGAAGCAKPAGEIVPYVNQPPEVTPGVPLHFATAMELGGYATGVIAESRDGRPIKIEGNPDHPASLGAAGVFEQASILQLYDPDRGRQVTHHGVPSSWLECSTAFSAAALQQRAGTGGAGLHLLLDPTASPTVLELLARVKQQYPEARVHFYAPLVNDSTVRGTSRALGQPLQPIYDLTRADIVVAADADPMGAGPFHLRYARQIADRRRVRRSGDAMNRLYVIEGRYTPTGIAADHRLAVRPGEIVTVLAALVRHVTAGDGRSAAASGLDRLADSTPEPSWVRALAEDLRSHSGHAVVIAGDRQPPLAHALACGLNAALGAAGSLVTYVEPVLPAGDGGITALVDAIRHGDVNALVILGGNPCYNAPADVEFVSLLSKVPLTLYSGLHSNETARGSEWYVPAAHYLESWGDARAVDGTASIVQPLIAPLHGGRSVVEVLAVLAGDGRPSQNIVRDFWQAPGRLGSDVEAWRDTLRRGVIAGTTSIPVSVAGRPAPASLLDETQSPRGALEVAFIEDPSVYDGRFANNAWLQELPDPVSKVTWDNAAFMNASTAARLGVAGSQVAAIDCGGRTLRVPVFVEPGIADGLIVIPFGYGRTGSETVAHGVGVNAFNLWTSHGYFDDHNVSVQRATGLGIPLVHDFAVTASHWSLEGRPILLTADLDRFRADPGFTSEHKGEVPALYGADYSSAPQWAMAIDLSVCTGCSACMVACQAENNVPVVGKGGVQQRREMHWLRIDRYLTGPGERLGVQPMLCQHCEDAPCEYVCPVNATVHSPDGLNEMVYNRCVGTRFCSNNCPYKVRRFNFFNYTSEMSETEKMAMNPDVTVRARGVMEKCTFCVQRIRRAEIQASISGSPDVFAELQTACQQACPTRAIVFGSIADGNARVTADAGADQSYRVLNDHGTRPRIHYLARLRNVNRAIPEPSS